MKNILIFASLFASILLMGAKISYDTPTGNRPTAVDGKKIYKQYCVTCHGIYGDMGASGAANLAISKLKLNERIEVITNGRKAMASFKALLDKEKIKAVAQYTMTLKPE
ncbi:MAG: cytochrome c [Bacteroidetes bacterium]|nr:cytochrome c [Bacteroidota bacterium]